MLAEHLHPKTYWEHRCELLEDAMHTFVRIVAEHGSIAVRIDLVRFIEDWGNNLRKITEAHPNPDGQEAHP